VQVDAGGGARLTHQADVIAHVDLLARGQRHRAVLHVGVQALDVAAVAQQVAVVDVHVIAVAPAIVLGQGDGAVGDREDR
jgi:hypothetical protein